MDEIRRGLLEKSRTFFLIEPLGFNYYVIPRSLRKYKRCPESDRIILAAKSRLDLRKNISQRYL